MYHYRCSRLAARKFERACAETAGQPPTALRQEKGHACLVIGYKK